MNNHYGQRRPANKPSEKRVLRTLLIVLAGVFAGLLIAVGVALYVINTPLPFQTPKPVDDTLIDQSQNQQLPLMVEGGNAPPPPPLVDSTADQPEEENSGTDAVTSLASGEDVPVTDGATPASTSTTATSPTTAKTIEEPVKNQYDFYDVLPNNDNVKATPTPPTTSSKPRSEKIYLQAGAFRNAQDADDLKASLALMGLEARIQTVIGPDNRSLHRVRVGPYRSQQEAEAAQKALTSGRISADIIKVSPPPSGQ